eukprot:5217698-Pleurochrysis_carterae.AAC.1
MRVGEGADGLALSEKPHWPNIACDAHTDQDLKRTSQAQNTPTCVRMPQADTCVRSNLRARLSPRGKGKSNIRRRCRARRTTVYVGTVIRCKREGRLKSAAVGRATAGTTFLSKRSDCGLRATSVQCGDVGCGNGSGGGDGSGGAGACGPPACTGSGSKRPRPSHS